MKILAVTFDVELLGGANRSFLMVIENLKKKYNHTIKVIIPGKGPIEKELISKGILYDIVDLPQTGCVLCGEKKDLLRKCKANIKAAIHYLKANIRYKSYIEYDLVYINGTSQLFGYYIAKKMHKPFVWHFRGYLTENHYYCFSQTKIFNDNCGKIIVISKSMFQNLPELLGIDCKHMTVIPNGLEMMLGRKKTILCNNSVNCVLCGRLISIKGQMEAIEALYILKRHGIKNVYLHFAGDLNAGNKRYIEELKKVTKKYDLQDKVIFEGQIDDMTNFREKMDIELMCSINEPFGRVTVEGMRSNLLVIGANTGGTLDIINNGYNGLLYEQGNPEDLAEKILYALNHPDKAQKISDNAYEFSKNNFTIDENVKKINEVLMEVKIHAHERQRKS
ncbi:glycosyltransferase family 4 protein [Faecalibacterium sp. An121]|uniref:glycosyltransferase family 4 protein n=1 Tax=Faecalibacterium sp. An121 TaxID=1965550 RepID=UPI000B38DEF5|nr:glycosyltransferase family 4 protein [Faecalibacterium sp. An121]OUQ37359.1 hypothetical protein B5E66_08595 [Faecalibacterium sp. An121]